MKFNDLTHRNILFFTRYYKLVAVAVAIAVAVIVGSLVVGDSVRTTLVRRVTERLGDTETILFSRNSFMEDKLAESSLFDYPARSILLTNGFISQNGRLLPVYVWGVDDMSISKGTARMNPSLFREFGGNEQDAIVLRLPSSGLVPSGSLFVTENYTTSLRLSFAGIAGVDEGGNISMKNEQVIPLNIFVNREELAETLETEGKVNLILANQMISADDLEKAWNYTLSGLSIDVKEHFTEITSDRIFLQEEVVDYIRRNNHDPNRLFSYLANSIETNSASIPYSFVTALDSYKGKSLQKDEIILSDYAAKRLDAREGDSVRVTYFTSQDLKTLHTDTASLFVKEIVPLPLLQEDETLSANFPGLSDVERCTDWDSDLPIDMNLITVEDEKYWDLYRSTPKALIAYEAVTGDWKNAYGNATAIRVSDSIPYLSGLRAEMFGIQVIHPREAGLYAARNGVDFAGLFLALGFFIILSALLLMLVPLSEMLYQRRNETELLKALGYNRKRIIRMLWMESAPIVLLSAIAGVIAGLVYTILIMWLLGSVWKGATHTEGFSVYPSSLAILAGFLTGIGLSLLLLHYAITRNLKEKRRKEKHPIHSLTGKRISVVLSTLLVAGIIFANFFIVHSVVLFVVAGVVLIGTAALWGDFLVYRKALPGSPDFTSGRMIGSTLFAKRKQALLSFFTLATGVFIVFSVGLNRKGFADSSQLRTGTGGYSLWCETAVPVYHNLSAQAGREKLSLTDLPEDAEVLQCLRYSADDASCLNLNKVSTPTVLGVDMETLAASDFRIEQSLYAGEKEDIFKQQIKRGKDPVYPALVDATVLTWSLMMNLGDTLWYESRGKTVGLQLAGTLSNSIFQGNILIDRSFFSEIWEETTGSEIFLLKVDEPEKEEVKTLLSQALNEYGIRVTTTNERLKQFNTVTDTYLTIFLTLGGLGLLLGIMGFIIVVRKNLATRRQEVALYRTLGFTDKRIEEILYKENLLVPLYAIATGVISSLVGVSTSFMNTGIWIWITAFLFTLFFVLCVIIFTKKSIKNCLNEFNI